MADINVCGIKGQMKEDIILNVKKASSEIHTLLVKEDLNMRNWIRNESV